VGIFIARIGSVRTIRRLCTRVAPVPTMCSILWPAAFGGIGIHIGMFRGGRPAMPVFADVTPAPIASLDHVPSGAGACPAIFVLQVASAASGTVVPPAMTGGAT
jgi:choline-glycine betaine transporter